MIIKDSKGNLEVTRGNYLPLTITTEIDGSPYVFKVGDVVRFSITEENNCERVLLRKEVTISEESESATIIIPSQEMRFGRVISEPVTYWYEVELNPDKPEAQTIIGYTVQDGPKLITLTPESGGKR